MPLTGVRDDADLAARAERIRAGVMSAPILLPGIPTITPTVSVGVARSGAGLSIDDLFASADSAIVVQPNGHLRR